MKTPLSQRHNHRIARALLGSPLVVLCAVATLVSASETPTRADLAATIEKSFPYLEKDGVKWMKKHECVSCHQVPFMLWSLQGALQHDLSFDRAKVEEWSRWSDEKMRKLEADPESKPPIDTLYQLLLGREYLDETELSRKMRDTYTGYLLARQEEDGHWKAGGQLPFQKRPEAETHEITTTWILVALLPSAGDEKVAEALKKARAWLKNKPGVSTEWWATRLLFANSEDDQEGVAKYRTALLKRQNADGSWNWADKRPADAYATGVALYALSKVDSDEAKPAIEKAWTYLRSTQRGNGSWANPSTKKKNDDKVTGIASYWGTAWAVIGLSESLAFAK